MSLTESVKNQNFRRPVILLGASNLTRDFPLILRLLESSLSTPYEIFTALGHGRSYGNWSRLLHRALPGIAQCEIWNVIPEKDNKHPQPLALLTDIGNDLVYGQSVDAIFGWIENCINRLQAINAKISVTLLPEASLSQLSSFRFELTRRLFFPHNHISLESLKQNVSLLNSRLSDLSKHNCINVLEIPSECYGFDPIHYRYSHRATLWKMVLSQWESPDMMNLAIQNRWHDFVYSVTQLHPAVKRQWGKTMHSPQPTRILKDGTPVSVY